MHFWEAKSLHHVWQVLLKRIHSANTRKSAHSESHIPAPYVTITSEEDLCCKHTEKCTTAHSESHIPTPYVTISFEEEHTETVSCEVISTHSWVIPPYMLVICTFTFIFPVFAPWILFRTTCHTWWRTVVEWSDRLDPRSGSRSNFAGSGSDRGPILERLDRIG